MKVKISYQVNLEEVPETAETLGYKAHLEIKEAASLLLKALENIEECGKDFTLIKSMINKTRLKLAEADSILDDTSSIIKGIHNYYQNEGVKDVPEGRSTMDTGGNATEQAEDPGQG